MCVDLKAICRGKRVQIAFTIHCKRPSFLWSNFWWNIGTFPCRDWPQFLSPFPSPSLNIHTKGAIAVWPPLRRIEREEVEKFWPSLSSSSRSLSVLCWQVLDSFEGESEELMKSIGWLHAWTIFSERIFQMVYQSKIHRMYRTLQRAVTLKSFLQFRLSIICFYCVASSSLTVCPPAFQGHFSQSQTGKVELAGLVVNRVDDSCALDLRQGK